MQLGKGEAFYQKHYKEYGETSSQVDLEKQIDIASSFKMELKHLEQLYK